MSVARQTTETIRADFDRIAPLARAGWDHNAHYHDFLLRQVPEHWERSSRLISRRR